MSIVNIINNEEITLVQGVGGLFLCEESWVIQSRKNTQHKTMLDQEVYTTKSESINTDHL